MCHFLGAPYNQNKDKLVKSVFYKGRLILTLESSAKRLSKNIFYFKAAQLHPPGCDGISSACWDKTSTAPAAAVPRRTSISSRWKEETGRVQHPSLVRWQPGHEEG